MQTLSGPFTACLSNMNNRFRCCLRLFVVLLFKTLSVTAWVMAGSSVLFLTWVLRLYFCLHADRMLKGSIIKRLNTCLMIDSWVGQHGTVFSNSSSPWVIVLVKYQKLYEMFKQKYLDAYQSPCLLKDLSSTPHIFKLPLNHICVQVGWNYNWIQMQAWPVVEQWSGAITARYFAL